MEYQHDLETDEPLIVSNSFTRAVERTTGRDVFPSIDAVARVAAKDSSVFTLLMGEAERAHNQGVRNQKYSPEVYELGKTPFANQALAFLNEVYAVARSQAPKKELHRVLSHATALPSVSNRYSSDSGRYKTYGGQ